MEQEKGKKNINSLIISLLIGASIGAIMAVVLIMFREKTIIGEGMLGFFLSFLSLFVFALVSAYLHIIIHEAGHLVFGLITGYKLVSFRVGSITLINKSGKLFFKKYLIPGTGGQCLMVPPGKVDDKIPYKLYNLGGVIFNIVFSLIAILILALFDLSGVVFIFLFLFAVVGIIIGIMNDIPMKMSGLGNDGYNLRLLTKDHISRRAFYLQLKINGLQTDGVRLKDMPEEWFTLPDNADVSNNLHLSILLLRSAWYMDLFKFDDARQCLEEIAPYADNLIGLYQKERDSELLFLEIIGEGRTEVISSLYTDELKKYLEQYSKYMFSKRRTLYAYTIAVEKNKEKAESIFNDALRMQDKYPMTGDAESELELMEYVRKIYL